MKKNNFFVLSCLLLPHLFLLVHAQANRERLIYFDLREEKLLDIINRLAGEKQVNLLLPYDQKNLSETTVTFRLAHKISLTQAWDMVATMLDIAGFALIKQSNSLYLIQPNTVIDKAPAPLYINTKTELLPNNDTIIRYLYFFQNIILKGKDGSADKSIQDNLKKILTDMLPEQQPGQTFFVDENYNSLVITNKSNAIKSVVNIIRELDQGGFREAIEVVPIIHTSIDEITKTIGKLISKREETEFRYPSIIAEPKGNKTYFSSSTRIVPLEQTHSVAIFGLYESVQRVKDFIQKYLDKSVDAEKTVLHIKPLHHLDSEKFAKVLSDFINKMDDKGVRSTALKDKLLGTVIIQAETEAAVVKPASEPERKLEADASIGVALTDTSEQKPTIGGNNLIIAATHRDWKIVEALIEQLDTPQFQVALEVLIVDMTIESSNELNAQLRRITNDNHLHELKWQSAQIAPPALDYTGAEAPTYATRFNDINPVPGLEADLESTQPPLTSSGSTYNIAGSATAGSTVFTFRDKNGIATILTLLKSHTDSKILAQPFIITCNNQQANILDKTTKWVRGEVIPASLPGGAPVIKYSPVIAATRVSMTPRMSMHGDNINLEIRIDANDFIGTSDNITKRTVITNANVGDQEVLVLGGISKTQLDDSINGVPVLSKIPFIGHLFKGQSMNFNQRYLVIFISPARIAPVDYNASMNVSTNNFTQEKIAKITNEFTTGTSVIACQASNIRAGENFQCLTDPITTFMFPYTAETVNREIYDFAERSWWKKETAAKESARFKKAMGATQEVDPQPTPQQPDKLKKILKNEENPLKKKK